jgi:hypothetical protein
LENLINDIQLNYDVYHLNKYSNNKLVCFRINKIIKTLIYLVSLDNYTININQIMKFAISGFFGLPAHLAIALQSNFSDTCVF